MFVRGRRIAILTAWLLLSALSYGVSAQPKNTISGANTVSIKTNVASWGLSVANLGVEMAVNDHVSIDIPVWFSPYDLSAGHKFRIYAYQPELRYWIASCHAMYGWFVGVHAHMGWFNVAYGDRYRYQDNAPVWGGGIGGGYVMPLSRRWSVEFNLGVGYARLSYDKYMNESNGAWVGAAEKNYWGLTRLGIGITYRFGLKR